MSRPFVSAHARRIPAPLLVFVVLIATLVLACAGSVGSAGNVPTPRPSATLDPASSTAPTAPAASQPLSAASPAPTALAPSPAPTGDPTAAAQTDLRVYLFAPDQGGQSRLVPVERSVPTTVAVARAAILALLAGPSATEGDLSTMIPTGTKLLGINLEAGVATVDLSGTFESGGGSASMLGRLAQLVYTATQFPTVSTVQLRLDGAPVSTLGSADVPLGVGLGRTDQTAALPAIFVEAPAWGGDLPSGGSVSGLANVFEAQFRLQLRDSAGQILIDLPVSASCGSGCWGRFAATVRYQVKAAQWGTLRVFDASAKDGSPIDVRDYPVWLTPAG